MELLQVPAGTTASTQVSFLPQFIGVKLGAGVLDRISIQRLGSDVVMNITGESFERMARLRNKVANGSTTILWLPCANGLVGGNVDITVTAGAGATLEIYGRSEVKGGVLVSYAEQTVLANSEVRIQDFAFATTDYATGDTMNIEYSQGLSQRFGMEEYATTQDDKVNNDSDVVIIDNLDQQISSIQSTPVANRLWCVARFNNI